MGEMTMAFLENDLTNFVELRQIISDHDSENVLTVLQFFNLRNRSFQRNLKKI